MGGDSAGAFPFLGASPLTGAYLAWAGLVVLALFLGWTMGDGLDDLQEVGGLATAQRGTAAALIVAQDNFDDPRVLVVITLLTVFGVVVLIIAAKLLSREDSFSSLLPQVADVPEGSAHDD